MLYGAAFLQKKEEKMQIDLKKWLIAKNLEATNSLPTELDRKSFLKKFLFFWRLI